MLLLHFIVFIIVFGFFLVVARLDFFVGGIIYGKIFIFYFIIVIIIFFLI